ncbi:MAG: hypothetical protein WD802_11425 [Gemmatimonadaceae bacterium]
MQLFHPSHLLRRTMMVAASIIVSLAGTGCGSDSLVAPGIGSGTLTATGAVSASGTGLALFQSVSSGGTNLFQILIAPASQSTTTWQLQIANYSGRPAAGTYNLSALSPSSADPTASLYYTSGGTMQVFNSTSGQLVISSSSPSSVRGTFTFTATDPAGGTATVTANGTFNAQCAPGLTCL